MAGRAVAVAGLAVLWAHTARASLSPTVSESFDVRVAPGALLPDYSVADELTAGSIKGGAQSVVLLTGSDAADADNNVQIFVTSDVADGQGFTLTCASSNTQVIGSASGVAYVGAASDDPDVDPKEYSLSGAFNQPKQIFTPAFTAGSDCSAGQVCSGVKAAVTVTCTISGSSAASVVDSQVFSWNFEVWPQAVSVVAAATALVSPPSAAGDGSGVEVGNYRPSKLVLHSGDLASGVSGLATFRVARNVPDGGKFTLTCTSAATDQLGSPEAAVTYESKVESPDAAEFQYDLTEAGTEPVEVAVPQFTGGGRCSPGRVCAAASTDVAVTCAVSDSTAPAVANGDESQFVVQVLPRKPVLSKAASLTCEVNEAVDGAQLRPDDFATTTIFSAEPELLILPGTEAYMADRPGTKWLPGLPLTPEDRTEAVELQDYAAGDLFEVAFKDAWADGSTYTVTCLLDPRRAAVMSDTTNPSDYRRTFTAGSLTPQGIRLGQVASISTPTSVALTCTAVNEAGREIARAATTVVATPLAIRVFAGTAAKADEATVVPNLTIVSGSATKLWRVEGTADTPGATLKVALNGNPGASVDVKCTSQDTDALPDNATESSYKKTFTTSNGTTPQDVTLGEVATSLKEAKDVVIQCELSAAVADSGLELASAVEGDAARVTVQVAPLAIRIAAGDAAVDARTGSLIAPGTLLAADARVRRVEAQDDAEGRTLEVVLSGMPGDTVVIQCTSSLTNVLPNSATETDYEKTFTTSDGTTPQGLTLGTVANTLTTATDVTITCRLKSTVSNSGLEITSTTATDVAKVFITATPLAIEIGAGTSAVDAATGLPIAESTIVSVTGAATPRTKVLRGEMSPDTNGGTFKVRLNGNPAAPVTVTCASGNASLLPECGGSLFTVVNTTATDGLLAGDGATRYGSNAVIGSSSAKDGANGITLAVGMRIPLAQMQVKPGGTASTGDQVFCRSDDQSKWALNNPCKQFGNDNNQKNCGQEATDTNVILPAAAGTSFTVTCTAGAVTGASPPSVMFGSSYRFYVHVPATIISAAPGFVLRHSSPGKGLAAGNGRTYEAGAAIGTGAAADSSNGLQLAVGSNILGTTGALTVQNLTGTSAGDYVTCASDDSRKWPMIGSCTDHASADTTPCNLAGTIDGSDTDGATIAASAAGTSFTVTCYANHVIGSPSSFRLGTALRFTVHVPGTVFHTAQTFQIIDGAGSTSAPLTDGQSTPTAISDGASVSSLTMVVGSALPAGVLKAKAVGTPNVGDQIRCVSDDQAKWPLDGSAGNGACSPFANTVTDEQPCDLGGSKIQVAAAGSSFLIKCYATQIIGSTATLSQASYWSISVTVPDLDSSLSIVVANGGVEGAIRDSAGTEYASSATVGLAAAATSTTWADETATAGQGIRLTAGATIGSREGSANIVLDLTWASGDSIEVARPDGTSCTSFTAASSDTTVLATDLATALETGVCHYEFVATSSSGVVTLTSTAPGVALPKYIVTFKTAGDGTATFSDYTYGAGYLAITGGSDGDAFSCYSENRAYWDIDGSEGKGSCSVGSPAVCDFSAAVIQRAALPAAGDPDTVFKLFCTTFPFYGAGTAPTGAQLGATAAITIVVAAEDTNATTFEVFNNNGLVAGGVGSNPALGLISADGTPYAQDAAVGVADTVDASNGIQLAVGDTFDYSTQSLKVVPTATCPAGYDAATGSNCTPSSDNTGSILAIRRAGAGSPPDASDVFVCVSHDQEKWNLDGTAGKGLCTAPVGGATVGGEAIRECSVSDARVLPAGGGQTFKVSCFHAPIQVEGAVAPVYAFSDGIAYTFHVHVKSLTASDLISPRYSLSNVTGNNGLVSSSGVAYGGGEAIGSSSAVANFQGIRVPPGGTIAPGQIQVFPSPGSNAMSSTVRVSCLSSDQSKWPLDGTYKRGLCNPGTNNASPQVCDFSNALVAQGAAGSTITVVCVASRVETPLDATVPSDQEDPVVGAAYEFTVHVPSAATGTGFSLYSTSARLRGTTGATYAGNASSPIGTGDPTANFQGLLLGVGEGIPAGQVKAQAATSPDAGDQVVCVSENQAAWALDGTAGKGRCNAFTSSSVVADCDFSRALVKPGYEGSVFYVKCHATQVQGSASKLGLGFSFRFPVKVAAGAPNDKSGFKLLNKTATDGLRDGTGAAYAAGAAIGTGSSAAVGQGVRIGVGGTIVASQIEAIPTTAAVSTGDQVRCISSNQTYWALDGTAGRGRCAGFDINTDGGLVGCDFSLARVLTAAAGSSFAVTCFATHLTSGQRFLSAGQAYTFYVFVPAASTTGLGFSMVNAVASLGLRDSQGTPYAGAAEIGIGTSVAANTGLTLAVGQNVGDGRLQAYIASGNQAGDRVVCISDDQSKWAVDGITVGTCNPFASSATQDCLFGTIGGSPVPPRVLPAAANSTFNVSCWSTHDHGSALSLTVGQRYVITVHVPAIGEGVATQFKMTNVDADVGLRSGNGVPYAANAIIGSNTAASATDGVQMIVGEEIFTGKIAVIPEAAADTGDQVVCVSDDLTKWNLDGQPGRGQCNPQTADTTAAVCDFSEAPILARPGSGSFKVTCNATFVFNATSTFTPGASYSFTVHVPSQVIGQTDCVKTFTTSAGTSWQTIKLPALRPAVERDTDVDVQCRLAGTVSASGLAAEDTAKAVVVARPMSIVVQATANAIDAATGKPVGFGKPLTQTLQGNNTLPAPTVRRLEVQPEASGTGTIRLSEKPAAPVEVECKSETPGTLPENTDPGFGMYSAVSNDGLQASDGTVYSLGDLVGTGTAVDGMNGIRLSRGSRIGGSAVKFCGTNPSLGMPAADDQVVCASEAAGGFAEGALLRATCNTLSNDCLTSCQWFEGQMTTFAEDSFTLLCSVSRTTGSATSVLEGRSTRITVHVPSPDFSSPGFSMISTAPASGLLSGDGTPYVQNATVGTGTAATNSDGIQLTVGSGIQLNATAYLKPSFGASPSSGDDISCYSDDRTKFAITGARDFGLCEASDSHNCRWGLVSDNLAVVVQPSAAGSTFSIICEAAHNVGLARTLTPGKAVKITVHVPAVTTTGPQFKLVNKSGGDVALRNGTTAYSAGEELTTVTLPVGSVLPWSPAAIEVVPLQTANTGDQVVCMTAEADRGLLNLSGGLYSGACAAHANDTSSRDCQFYKDGVDHSAYITESAAGSTITVTCYAARVVGSPHSFSVGKAVSFQISVPAVTISPALYLFNSSGTGARLLAADGTPYGEKSPIGPGTSATSSTDGLLLPVGNDGGNALHFGVSGPCGAGDQLVCYSQDQGKWPLAPNTTGSNGAIAANDYARCNVCGGACDFSGALSSLSRQAVRIGAAGSSFQVRCYAGVVAGKAAFVTAGSALEFTVHVPAPVENSPGFRIVNNASTALTGLRARNGASYPYLAAVGASPVATGTDGLRVSVGEALLLSEVAVRPDVYWNTGDEVRCVSEDPATWDVEFLCGPAAAGVANADNCTAVGEFHAPPPSAAGQTFRLGCFAVQKYGDAQEPTLPTAGAVRITVQVNTLALGDFGYHFFFNAENGTTGRNLKLGVVPAGLAEPAEVTVRCGVKDAATGAGMAPPDQVAGDVSDVAVRATPLEIGLKAGSQLYRVDALPGGAAYTVGAQVDPDTLLGTADTDIYLLSEGIQYGAGDLFRATLTGEPVGSVGFSCVLSEAGILPTWTGTITAASTVDNPAFASAYSTATSDKLAQVTCTVTTAGTGSGLSVSQKVAVNVLIRAQGFEVAAGSAAWDASSCTVSALANPALCETFAEDRILSGTQDEVQLVEGTDDSGLALKIRLAGGAPPGGASGGVECASSNPQTIDSFTINSLSFTNQDWVTLAVPAPNPSVTAPTSVTLSCKPTGGSFPGSLGAEGASPASIQVLVLPASIQIVAGSGAFDKNGIPLPPSTLLSPGPPGAFRTHGVADSSGETLLVSTSARLSASVPVTCTAADPASAGVLASYSETRTITAGSVSGQELTLPPLSPPPRDGDLVIKQANSIWVPHTPAALLTTATSRATVGANSELELTLTNGSTGYTIPAAAAVKCTAYEDVEFKKEDASALRFDFALDLDATGLLPGAATGPVQAKVGSVAVRTERYVRCVVSGGGSDWEPVKTTFVLSIIPEMVAVAGSSGPPSNTLSLTPIPAGADLSALGDACRTPVVFEQQATASGEVVQIKFNSPVSAGKLECSGSPLFDDFAINSLSGTSVNVPLPTPPSVSVITVANIQCSVAPSPEPLGLSTDATVKLVIAVHPRTVDVVVGTGGATRLADRTAVTAGYSLGYSAGAAARDTRTALVFEGQGLSTSLALKLAQTPEGAVTFSCTSTSAAEDSPSPTDVTVGDTAAKDFSLPSGWFESVAEDKRITFSCKPDADAGGFTTSATNHEVKFDVVVAAARLKVVATGASVTPSASGKNIIGGTDISIPKDLAQQVDDLTLQLFVGAASNGNTLTLTPNVNLGASAVVDCASSAPDVMADITGVVVQQGINPAALTLPPTTASATAEDVLVTYECKAKADVGPTEELVVLAATDVARFAVKVIAIKTSVVAIGADGAPAVDLAASSVERTTVADGQPLPASYKDPAFVVVEKQAPTYIGVAFNAQPPSVYSFSCTTEPEGIVEVPVFTANGTKEFKVTAYSPSIDIAGKMTRVQVKCTGTSTSSSGTSTAQIDFAVAVEPLKLEFVAGLLPSTTTQEAGELTAVDTVRIPEGSLLVPGDLGRTPLLDEMKTPRDLAGAIRVRANGAIGADLKFTCLTSKPSVIAGFEFVLAAATSGSTGTAVPLPMLEDVAVTTPVTIECVPAAPGGFPDSNYAQPGFQPAEDKASFDVSVKPLSISVLAGTNAQNALLATLPAGVPLTRDDLARMPIVDNTLETESGEVVQVQASGTVSGDVTYLCISNQARVLGTVNVTIRPSNKTSVIDVKLPTATEVDANLIVRYFCAPSTSVGGLKSSDEYSFDIMVRPRSVDVLASQSVTVTNTAGKVFQGGSVLSGGGGNTPQLVQVFSGVTYEAGATFSLRANVAPTPIVVFECVSSVPEVLANIPNVRLISTDPVDVEFPVPGSVAKDTRITYTCAPNTGTGGYSTNISTQVDVLVSQPRVDVVAGAGLAGREAFDGETVFLEGDLLSGSQIDKRTVVRREEEPEAEDWVLLKPTVAPTSTIEYECKSSLPSALADIKSVKFSTAAAVPITLPSSDSVSTVTRITYKCTQRGTETLVTPAPAAAAPARRLSGTERGILQTDAATPAPDAATPAPDAATPAPDATTPTPDATTPTPASTTAAPTTSAPSRVPLVFSNEVAFDVVLYPLKPVVKAGSAAKRSDTLLSFEAGTVLGTGAGAGTALPVVEIGTTYTAGVVATLGLDAGTPTAAVDVSCTSSAEAVLPSITGVVLPAGATSVGLPIPAALSTGGGAGADTVVTYTCGPTKPVGGLDTGDTAEFDVLVHAYGLQVLAGAQALDRDTLTAIEPGTNIGYPADSALPNPIVPVLVAESASATSVVLRSKSPATQVDKDVDPVAVFEVPVNVLCKSSDEKALRSFAVASVLSTSVPVTIPQSELVTEPTDVQLTCTVECASAPYTGKEQVRFRVFILPRAILAVAGSDPGQASDLKTALQVGQRLVSGEPARTVVVMELKEEAAAGSLVKLYNTVPLPSGEALTVRCDSSDPLIMADIDAPGTQLTSSTQLVGGTPFALPLPTAQPVDADTLVTYTCRPSAPAGGYSTAVSTAFQVLVRNQAVEFYTGPRAIAVDDSGKQLDENVKVKGLAAIESTQYAAGDLVRVRALDNAVSVVCLLETSDEAVTGLSSAVLETAQATSLAIAVPSSEAEEPLGIYLPRTPDVTGGKTATVLLKCSPGEDSAATGYKRLDVFTLAISIGDLSSPVVDIPYDQPRITFTVGLSFKIQPQQAVVDAIGVEIRAVVLAQLQAADPNVTAEDISIVLRVIGGRRLLEYRVAFDVTVKAATQAAAEGLARALDADGAAQLQTAIEAALVIKSTDPRSPLNGTEVPAVSTAPAQVALITPPPAAPTDPPGTPPADPPTDGAAWHGASGLLLGAFGAAAVLVA